MIQFGQIIICEFPFADFIEKIIENLSDFKEAYVQKDEIISREEVKKVGITDTGILLACCIQSITSFYLRHRFTRIYFGLTVLILIICVNLR